MTMFAELFTIPGWVAEAACSPETAALFFPEGGARAKRDAWTKAAAICAECPVIALCEAEDRARPIPLRGFLAGQTENQRRVRRGLPPRKDY